MGMIKDILADIGKNPTEFLNQYLETKKVTDQILNPFLESIRRNSERNNEKREKKKAGKKKIDGVIATARIKRNALRQKTNQQYLTQKR